MMKNKFLFLMILGVTFLAGCNDDDDKSWKKIPQEEIDIQNATFAINGDQATTGSLQMTVKNESSAVLSLKNVIPGYAEVPIDVRLEKQEDDSFVFSGETGLTSSPAILVRSTVESIIMYVKVSGTISLEGKVSATASTRLSESVQAGLTGSWDLLSTIEMDQDIITNAPLFITWSAIEKDAANMEVAANLGNMFGSMILYNVLNQVTFHEDGNITAKYWDGISSDNLWATLDDTTGILSVTHDWSTSPKNLVFWYAKNDMIYVVPNINAILKQAGVENEIDLSTGNLSGLDKKLKEYNINIDPIIPTVMGWLTTGVPVKYMKNGDVLKIYIDKGMATPFITALLPALDKLQADYEAAQKTESANPLIGMVLGILQIEKLTDIKTIWEENTNEFEISLNFVSVK